MEEPKKYKICIYKIWWNGNDDDLYVGGTKVLLSARISKTRYQCRKGKSTKLYDAIRKNGYDFNYVMLESFMICNRDEQRMHEQTYIDKLNPSLNMIKAHRTVAEKKIYLKDYYVNNKDKYIVDKAEKSEYDKKRAAKLIERIKTKR